MTAHRTARRAAQQRAEVPLDLDITAVLAAQLQAAETAARAVLVEHAAAVEAALAQLPAWVQKTVRGNAAALGGPLLVEHNEPGRARPCGRCEAARWLLVQAHEVRFHLANGAAAAAVLSALSVGRLQLRLGLAPTEDEAERGRPFVNGPRGPRCDLLNRALEEMLADKPNLTAGDVAAAWEDFVSAPACVQEVEPDGTVSWTRTPGDERRTSADGITKRLQRLRRKRALHHPQKTLID